MPIKTPHLLKENDLVALVGPASPVDGDKDVAAIVSAIEAMGFRVKPFPSASARHDYLAGTDRQRAGDLNRAFADDKIKAILCIRGGYGSSRLLSMIDWKAAGKSRKPLLGFSDITSLLGAMHRNAGLVSYHAVMGTYLMKDDEATRLMQESTRSLLLEGHKGRSLREMAGKHFKPQSWKKGKATGTLVGGNLSLFAGLVGTPYMPQPKKAVLFLEEIGEKPYKLDRYITQLVNAGFFKNVTGIALGDFSDCDPKAPDTGTCWDVLRACLAPLGVPILAGLPVGHCRPTWWLPMGAEVELDASPKGDLRIL